MKKKRKKKKVTILFLHKKSLALEKVRILFGPFPVGGASGMAPDAYLY